jgi:hypothetical protein
MYDVTPLRVMAAVAVYGALLALVMTLGRRAGRDERRTYVAVAGVWAVSVFAANYVLYLAGLMSYLPWVTNFLHTFVWIGVCLTAMYLGVREDWPLALQFALFAGLSLVVKVAEQQLFGTWELDHFLHVFPGNAAYVIGWSLADGLYPVLTLLGLRLAGRRVPGLMPA